MNNRTDGYINTENRKAGKEEMELTGLYMIYLFYVNDTVRYFPKNGLDFTANVPEETECLLTFQQDRTIHIICSKGSFVYSCISDFRNSVFFEPVIRKMCSIFPGITQTYDDLVNMGIKDYENIMYNSSMNSISSKKRDAVLDLDTEFDITLKTASGNSLNIEFNSLSGDCRLTTEYAEYQGKLNDVIFESSDEYINSFTAEDIENKIMSLKKEAVNGKLVYNINGSYYDSVQEFFDEQKDFLIEDIDF